MNESIDDIQIGGHHYKTMRIQPWAAMEAWMTKPEHKAEIIRFAEKLNITKVARID